jgi:hypothetical protein
VHDGGGDEELHHRDESKKPTAQGERFHRFGLEDAPEQLPGPLMAHLLRLKPQGPREEALLEEPPGPDGEPPL